jgi:hypothetical protein
VSIEEVVMLDNFAQRWLTGSAALLIVARSGSAGEPESAELRVL